MDSEEGHRLLIAEYSRMAAIYDRDYAPYHAPMVARLLDLAKPSDAETTLELGCGTGILAFEAARHVGLMGRVIGIDCAEGMIFVATEKGNHSGAERVRFLRMDNRDLAFADGAFDVVAACFGVSSLGHERAFREAYRVLVDGGRLVLCHYAGGGKGPAVPPLLSKFRPKEVPEEIRKLLEARRAINSTGEPAAFGEPQAVVKKLRANGFREVTCHPVVERVVYPDVAAYLARGLAMGDNEREFRMMRPATREAFLRAFEEEASAFVTAEGLVAFVGANYVVARK